MLRNLGLRQRITGILAGGAVVTALIVGLSLHELTTLQALSDAERAAEQRRETVNEVVIVALGAATAFSSIGLDLTTEEQKKAIEESDALLQRLEALQTQIAPILQDVLSTTEREALGKSIREMRHAWQETKEDFGRRSHDEQIFHLAAAVIHAGRVRALVAKADEIVHSSARAAAKAFDLRAVQARQTIFTCLIVGMAGMLAAGWLLLHYGVKRPLGAAIAAVTRIADGDITSPVPAATTSDEIGAILSALQVFRENAQARRRLSEDRARDMLERDKRREGLEETIAAFRAAVVAALGESEQSMQAMSLAARELIAAAADTQISAGHATDASHEVSANVAGVAAATQQLSGSADSISHSVKQAETAIGQAAQRARMTSASIDGLAEAAQTIGDVVSFIDSVAGQTNLLALNATIEAARAGAAGRGFAVVASEVKSLATQTAAATDKITTRINDMRGRTAAAVNDISAIVSNSGEATTHATVISAAVESQNMAAVQITRNLQDAAGWTADLSRVVENLAMAVARTQAAAEHVQTASGASAAVANKFDVLVEEFLERVVAA